tara:strand:- start:244 stop:567 length:324 start_codon:yes stop_codon:yes gene_type:complete
MIFLGKKNLNSIKSDLKKFLRLRVASQKKDRGCKHNVSVDSYFNKPDNQKFNNTTGDFCETLQNFWRAQGLENLVSSTTILQRAVEKLDREDEDEKGKISDFTYPMH